MWHSRPPPLHGKYHLKFPFWLSAHLPMVWIEKMRKQWLEAKSWTQITKNTHTVAGGNWKCHPCPPQGVCPTIWKQCFSLSWQTSTFHSSSPAQLKLGREVLKAFPSSANCLHTVPQPLPFSLYSPPVPGCCSPNQHRIVLGLVGGSVPE